MIEWVRRIYQNTRGRELPGNYNHILLSELFHEQSSRWSNIAQNHICKLSTLVSRFLEAALAYVIVDEQVRVRVQSRIQISLEDDFKKAQEELKKILSDEKIHPITYNHYFTDNIQKVRVDAMKKRIQNSIDSTVTNDWNGKLHISNTAAELQKLVSALKNRVVDDMNEQACLEALTALQAYYKVSMKTFVDNVCRQVIERHIINGVIQVFNPASVSELSEDELLKLGSETAQVRNRRAELQRKCEVLEESLRELRE